MANNEKTIRPLYFKDVVDSDFAWDVVYEDCGIAFRNGLTRSYRNDEAREINMVIFVRSALPNVSASSRSARAM